MAFCTDSATQRPEASGFGQPKQEWCIARLFATHLHLSERGPDQVVAGAHRVLHLVERQVLVPHLVPYGDRDLPPRPITSATARRSAPENSAWRNDRTAESTAAPGRTKTATLAGPPVEAQPSSRIPRSKRIQVTCRGLFQEGTHALQIVDLALQPPNHLLILLLHRVL